MTIPDALRSVAAGAIFGGTLLASGVCSPHVMKSQMALTNFHLLRSFLSLSAAGAVIIAVFDKVGIAKAIPRSNSTLNWFSVYDANIIGGLLQGIGMASTGADPGTVLVQVATGSIMALWVALGGLLGAFSYVVVAPYLTGSAHPKVKHLEPKRTMQEHMSTSLSTMLLVYALSCQVVLAISFSLPVDSSWLNPIAGGYLISLSQSASLFLTSRPVGISGAYADIANYCWSILNGNTGVPLLTPSLLFGIGTFAGAKGLLPYIPVAAEIESVALSKGSVVASGAILIFGARLAGGCSAGHGISGLSTFSVSSCITVASMVAGGVGSVMILR